MLLPNYQVRFKNLAIICVYSISHSCLNSSISNPIALTMKLFSEASVLPHGHHLQLRSSIHLNKCPRIDVPSQPCPFLSRLIWRPRLDILSWPSPLRSNLLKRNNKIALVSGAHIITITESHLTQIRYFVEEYTSKGSKTTVPYNEAIMRSRFTGLAVPACV